MARCLEVWLTTEHPDTLTEIIKSVIGTSPVRVTARPPTSKRPWTFRYRALQPEEQGIPSDFFLTDPETVWFGDIWDELQHEHTLRDDAPPEGPSLN